MFLSLFRCLSLLSVFKKDRKACTKARPSVLVVAKKHHADTIHLCEIVFSPQHEGYICVSNKLRSVHGAQHNLGEKPSIAPKVGESPIIDGKT